MNGITERVNALRAWMEKKGLEAMVVPTMDPHNSEYVAEHWQCRRWISGFTGSAGTAVVTLSEALLWTDSRYWLQAEEQLSGTPYRLMKDLVDVTVNEWLRTNVKGKVGYCRDMMIPALKAELLEGVEAEAVEQDPFDLLWTDRPSFPLSQAERMPDELAGETAESKLGRLTAWLREKGKKKLLVTELSEIAWTLNLRGDDIPTARNPKIKAVLKEREIRADRDWRFILHAKATNDSIDVDKLYEIESYNMLNGKPLLKKQSFFTAYDYFEYLLEEMRPLFSDQTTDLGRLNLLALAALGQRVERHEFDNDSLMRAACVMNAVVKSLENEKSLTSIREKAQTRQWSVDKMFNNDAVWCFNNLKDWSPFFNESTISTAFELYKIERGLRKDATTMEKVRQKCRDKQLPFRSALDDEIRWVYQHKN